MDNTEKYNFIGSLNCIDCNIADDPETFREVTLEELLSFKDCTLACNSEDNVWQYYFVKTGETANDGFFIKILYNVVMRYLNENEKTI